MTDGDAIMTPKAAEAFAVYVGMGPGRSLTNLAHALAERDWYKTTPTARRVVADWSTKYRWQERLSAAITAKIDDVLAKAVEIDAQSFLRTSELLAKQLTVVEPVQVDTIIKMRESVRKPEPKHATGTVNFNLSMTLRAIVERVAVEQGLNAEDVLAEAESIISAGA
jgi:hypothetical protein